MYCKNCGKEITLGSNFCGTCETKVVDETASDASVTQTNSTGRLLTAPNYFFLALFLALFISYLSKGYPFIFALARSVGVSIIPLAFGVVYTLSDGKKSKVAYLVATIFFLIFFVGATLQSFEDGH